MLRISVEIIAEVGLPRRHLLSSNLGTKKSSNLVVMQGGLPVLPRDRVQGPTGASRWHLNGPMRTLMLNPLR